MTFDGRLLSGVSVLAAVVDSGSFSRRPRRSGCPPPGSAAPSHAWNIAWASDYWIGSTRSVRLTAEGEEFHARVSTHLSGLEEAATIASGTAFAVRGRLRINADGLFSRMILRASADGVHPALSRDTARIADAGRDGRSDRGRRRSVDPLRPTAHLVDDLPAAPASAYSGGWQARRIWRHTAVHESPRTSRIIRASCFAIPPPAAPFPWEFRRRKTLISVETKGPLLLTDVATMLEACQSGVGIAQVLEPSVQKLINDGSLVELFPDWPGTIFPLYAIYPSRSHPPAKVRAFIDFCLEKN